MRVLIPAYIIASLIVVNAHATSPQPPFVPQEPFQYTCNVQVERIQADASARYSGAFVATAIVENKTGSENTFNPSIEFDKLNWQSLPPSANEKPSGLQLGGLTATLQFVQSNGVTSAVLSSSISQISESKSYQLNSYKKANATFEVGNKVETEINVEERSNWINNEAPTGLLMSFTSLKVNCVRTK
jgi:hypothetical protein